MDNIGICNAVSDWLDCDSDCMGVWDWLVPSSSNPLVEDFAQSCFWLNRELDRRPTFIRQWISFSGNTFMYCLVASYFFQVSVDYRSINEYGYTINIESRLSRSLVSNWCKAIFEAQSPHASDNQPTSSLPFGITILGPQGPQEGPYRPPRGRDYGRRGAKVPAHAQV